MLQLAVGSLLAVTRLPICDEGFYGVPAQILSETGTLRNPVLEPTGFSYLRGVGERFYWMAPLGIVLQAGTFKLFGFSLVTQRELCVICGMGVVILWYSALSHLLPGRIAAIAAVLLASDYVFLSLCSIGRSDMISLFFTMAGLASYMHWRQQSLEVALVLANIFCALSGMVHPNGGIAAVSSLAVLILYLDRSRLQWKHLAIAAFCYGVLGVAWGIYIAEDPQLFMAQFFGNVKNRLSGPMTLTHLARGEMSRYASAYGLENSHGIKLLRGLLPASYLVAILYCLLSKSLRRKNEIRIFLIMFCSISLSLVFLEGAKQGWYLVHLSPLFAAFLAVCIFELWQGGSFLARMVALAQIAIVMLGIASLMEIASKQNLQQAYNPTVAFLNAHAQRTDLIFARSEFYFGLQCKSCLRDDSNLGALTGLKADYIVLDPDYEGQLSSMAGKHPGLYQKIEQQLKTDYTEVFRNRIYKIMRKN